MGFFKWTLKIAYNFRDGLTTALCDVARWWGNKMMDDSDLDFSDLCSRLLKRKLRKKTDEEQNTGDEDGEKPSRPAPSGPRQTKKTTKQLKKTRTKKDTLSEPVGKVESEPRAVLQDVSVSQLTENGIDRRAETQLATTQTRKGEVKEKVLSRMQRFKRVDPQKLQHTDSIPSTSAEPQCIRQPSSPEQSKGMTASLSSAKWKWWLHWSNHYVISSNLQRLETVCKTSSFKLCHEATMIEEFSPWIEKEYSLEISGCLSARMQGFKQIIVFFFPVWVVNMCRYRWVLGAFTGRKAGPPITAGAW